MSPQGKRSWFANKHMTVTSDDSAPHRCDSTLHILQCPRRKTPGRFSFFGSFPFLPLRLPCLLQKNTLETCASIMYRPWLTPEMFFLFCF